MMAAQTVYHLAFDCSKVFQKAPKMGLLKGRRMAED